MRSPELSRRGFLGLAALIPALPAILEALDAQEPAEAVLRYQEGTAIPRYHTGGLIKSRDGFVPEGTLFLDVGEHVLHMRTSEGWTPLGTIISSAIR